MTHKLQSSLFLLILFFIASCNVETDESWSQDAMGEIGDVAVLTDAVSWVEHGSLIDSIFAKDIPGMAGSEPFFTIRKCDETKFDDFYKKNYNLFVIIQRERWQTLKLLFTANMQAKIEGKFNPNGVVVFKGMDVWAKPQEVHFILVPNEQKMKETLQSKKASFLLQALETESRTTATTLFKGRAESDSFKANMINTNGYGFRKPNTYSTSLVSEECNGFNRYINAKRLGIYYYEESYNDEKQFSQDYIIKRRNDVLKKHISGSTRKDSIPTFMSTDTVNVKLFRQQLEINGLYAIETRGWWEMENDFMAGPFVNYTILCKKSNKVVSLDGNVFAPGHDKGKLLRQLELIAGTFEEKP